MANSVIDKASDNMRILSASMVENAKSGHPGGAMGGADFVNVLYSEFLRFDPDDMNWAFRDRFFLDPGHMSPMLYSILHLTGKFTKNEIENFRQWGSPTHGHPELSVDRGIENSSGPLGIGHAMGLGNAIGERFYAERFGEWASYKTYTFISDGGMQEEISQGVGRIAGHLKMSNFVMFFDSNDIQLSHTTDATITENTTTKYESWGWRVETIDGNNADEIRAALTRAKAETEKPTLIIGKTIMGKGAVASDGSSFEKMVSTHGQPLSAAGADIPKTIENLGGNANAPFATFPEVKEHFEKVLDKNRAEAKARKDEQAKWAAKNPELSAKLTKMLSGDAPEVDFSSIDVGSNVATRASSGKILAHFAQNLDNMIVSSADLSNSDQTGQFLAKSSEIQAGDFSGAFLQSGVAELTMAAIMNGLALHGGIIPVCGTFFVFSDYMKPAIRMAALMELPVKYVFTHDSFRVGEDGPTHQPVEQETQIRLLEKMANFSGKASVQVLRPCDSAETAVAWKLAVENTSSPTALILTRQNVADLAPVGNGTRYSEALNSSKGAYTVFKEKSDKLDLVLVGNGSEVSLLVEVAKKLTEQGKSVRVVSAISEGLYKTQTAEYQNSIIPNCSAPVFGLTAGLPDALTNLVGSLGSVFGREAFGASAPAPVLDEKFGYTADAVMVQIEKYLVEYNAKVEMIKAL